jgi:hypothetical protein
MTAASYEKQREAFGPPLRVAEMVDGYIIHGT